MLLKDASKGTASLVSLFDQGRRLLSTAQIETPDLDARLLLCEATGFTQLDLLTLPEQIIQPAAIKRYEGFLSRRLSYEPVSRIIGRREFWSLPFEINQHTLDPRADSETLVQAVLESVDDRNSPLRLIDLGTGSGCLLLAILYELPNAIGLGVDKNAETLIAAQKNAQNLGLSDRAHFQVGNWLEGIKQKFDILISNPPYIGLEEMNNLAPEVKNYDPPEALFAGEKGLNAYQNIASALGQGNISCQKMFLEIGFSQAAAVEAIFYEKGWYLWEKYQDLQKNDRVLAFCKKKLGN